mgnify:CR=1 FL=1
MNNITKETRKESYKKLELKKKSKLIYDNLDSEYTARELANKLYKKRFNKNSRKARNSAKANGISRVRFSRSCWKKI